MELLAGIPLVGQLTLVGLSFSLNLFGLVQYIRGELVSRKHVEEVQKMADQWQHAWEVSMQTQAANALALERMTVLADTFEHFLTSLPQAQTPSNGGTDT
jgi:hypothetical protein